MVFFKRTLVFVAFVCSFLGNAQAQQSSIVSSNAFQSGEWKGSLNRNRSDGSFFSCSMTSSYKSGITLMFTMQDTSTWKLSFIHPSWRLTKGQDYPILYWVDRSSVISGVTTAASSNHAILSLPSNSILFRLFRKGRVLTVDFSGQRFGFNLTGTSAALSQLFDCTSRYQGTRAGSRGTQNNNPFSTNSDNPFSTH